MESNPQAGPSTPELSEMAMRFLSRVQLTGQEVPAFNHVMDWIHRLGQPPAAPDPAAE